MAMLISGIPEPGAGRIKVLNFGGGGHCNDTLQG